MCNHLPGPLPPAITPMVNVKCAQTQHVHRTTCKRLMGEQTTRDSYLEQLSSSCVIIHGLSVVSLTLSFSFHFQNPLMQRTDHCPCL